MEIIWHLVNADQPLRFNELRRHVDVTATTLSRRLEEMSVLGLISRTVFPEVPARVEYELTERGQGLDGVMRSLSRVLSAESQVVTCGVDHGRDVLVIVRPEGFAFLTSVLPVAGDQEHGTQSKTEHHHDQCRDDAR